MPQSHSTLMLPESPLERLHRAIYCLWDEPATKDPLAALKQALADGADPNARCCMAGEKVAIGSLMRVLLNADLSDAMRPTDELMAMSQRIEEAWKVLHCWGADAQALSVEGSTPWHQWARKGDPGWSLGTTMVSSLLLDHNLWPNLPDQHGVLPVELAVECNEWWAAEVLLSWTTTFDSERVLRELLGDAGHQEPGRPSRPEWSQWVSKCLSALPASVLTQADETGWSPLEQFLVNLDSNGRIYASLLPAWEAAGIDWNLHLNQLSMTGEAYVRAHRMRPGYVTHAALEALVAQWDERQLSERLTSEASPSVAPPRFRL